MKDYGPLTLYRVATHSFGGGVLADRTGTVRRAPPFLRCFLGRPVSEVYRYAHRAGGECRRLSEEARP